MSADITEQYDSIYRYCYFKLKNREIAEDITQETFLRYFGHYHCATEEQALKCLYVIARNLCVDERRKIPLLPLPQEEEVAAGGTQTDGRAAQGVWEERIVTGIAVKAALAGLEAEEAELLLLRYVNELSVSAIAGIFGISRFAVRRRLLAASKKFRQRLGKEGF